MDFFQKIPLFRLLSMQSGGQVMEDEHDIIRKMCLFVSFPCAGDNYKYSTCRSVVMRLLYSCSELGLGHATRTLALGKQLEARGHKVHFFTGNRALQLLRREFKHVYPATPVGWYENAHGIIATASLL